MFESICGYKRPRKDPTIASLGNGAAILYNTKKTRSATVLLRAKKTRVLVQTEKTPHHR
jgi:hypothetical protein